MLFFLPLVNCWGQDGHRITGMLADAFLTPTTKAQVHDLLKSYGGIKDGAVWADQIKFRREFNPWSAPLHYADTKNDNPPNTCEYNDDTDCTGGSCVVGGISNYTMRLHCDSDSENRDVDALFLIHLIGDLFQPLHVSGRERGGNNIKIMFGKKKANFHSIWDSHILLKHLIPNFDRNLDKYVEYLIDEINGGKYAGHDWIPEKGIQDVNHNGRHEAVIEWAQESNALQCSDVWPDYEENPNQNFGSKYADDRYPLVEEQLAKAGVRMAYWLNQIFDSDECPKRKADAIESEEVRKPKKPKVETTSTITSTPTSLPIEHHDPQDIMDQMDVDPEEHLGEPMEDQEFPVIADYVSRRRTNKQNKQARYERRKERRQNFYKKYKWTDNDS